MKRFAILCALVLGACDKPTPEACEQALRNVSKLLGTENLNSASAVQGEVRQCSGGSTKASVECAIKATTLDALSKCGFEKVSPHPLGSNAGAGAAGSATAGTGSATAGTGSATATAGTGSAGSGH